MTLLHSPAAATSRRLPSPGALRFGHLHVADASVFPSTGGGEAHITCPRGSDLRLGLEGRKGICDAGELADSGAFGNLPCGEAFIAPVEGTAEGALVVSGSIASIGLVSWPVTLEVAGGNCVDATGAEGARLLDLLRAHGEAGTNVAELGIGTNEKAQLTGEILEDESLTEQITNLRKATVTDVVRTYVAAESVEEQWDLPGLEKVLREEWQVEVALRCAATDFQVDHFRSLCRFDAAPSANGTAPFVLDEEPPALDPGRDLYGPVLFQSGRFRRIRTYHRLRATTRPIMSQGPTESGSGVSRHHRVTLRAGFAGLALTALSLVVVPTTGANEQSLDCGPVPWTDAITIHVPATPGGGWDLTAKVIRSALLEEQLARDVRLVHSPGAGGLIGLAQFIEGQRGNSRALLVGGMFMIGAVASNQATVSLLDTTPVARLTAEPIVVAVPATSPVQSLDALIEIMVRRPALVSWVGGSMGGADQRVLLDLQRALGVTDMPYHPLPGGGVGEALAGGRFTAGVSGYSELEPLIRDGQLRPLAISAHSPIPDVRIPTFKELGIDVTFMNWRGVFAAPSISGEEQSCWMELIAGMVRSHSWHLALARHQWDDAFLSGTDFHAFVLAEHKQAERQLREAPRVAVGHGVYDEFCAGFPYEETEHQRTAIDATLDDLGAGRPMARLVCGDVGFGKTEVALRAAFAAIADDKQVVILCPTTLLAEQHFQTFSDRFADWPVRIAELSRFRSGKESTEIIRKLETGEIDIVIGTHKLLSKEVKLKRLGLVIIDEEHRFGVRQKEALKKLRAEVDVLTLTATPIPRTLQLALTGVRELSIIASPPVDRLTVRTFIAPFDPLVIREALLRERYRGGQAFYVVPRIEDLAGVHRRQWHLGRRDAPEVVALDASFVEVVEETLERLVVEANRSPDGVGGDRSTLGIDGTTAEEPVLDPRHHAAHLLDPPEVRFRLLLHLQDLRAPLAERDDGFDRLVEPVVEPSANVLEGTLAAVELERVRPAPVRRKVVAVPDGRDGKSSGRGREPSDGGEETKAASGRRRNPVADDEPRPEDDVVDLDSVARRGGGRGYASRSRDARHRERGDDGDGAADVGARLVDAGQVPAPIDLRERLRDGVLGLLAVPGERAREPQRVIEPGGVAGLERLRRRAGGSAAGCAEPSPRGHAPHRSFEQGAPYAPSGCIMPLPAGHPHHQFR